MSQLHNLRKQATSIGKASLAKANEIAEQLKLPVNINPATRQATANTDSRHQTGKTPIHVNNAFTKIIKAVQLLPTSTQSFVFTKTFSKIVPFVGTAGIVYEEVTPNKLVVSLDNKKSVQNHIGSVHAVAVTLLAETATGFILGINLPSDRLLVVKSYQVNFYRPLQKGQIAAVASLSQEQRQYIVDTPKGDMIIPCVIDDRNSNSERDPITVEMKWAWFPKSELKGRRDNNA